MNRSRHVTALIFAVLVFGCTAGAGAAETSGDNQPSAGKSKQDNGKGLTVDDLGRGLKSAARNIEQEIPKIGPAIGSTFKNLTGKGSGKSEPQTSDKDKK
ncbi:MAG: hypothetical protein NT179_02260 [Nitrospirae bacterium]|nr:hypothetical protein [Nitrospirota bacterium]